MPLTASKLLWFAALRCSCLPLAFAQRHQGSWIYHAGSKTPLRTYLEAEGLSFKDLAPHPPGPDYELVFADAVMRHGTRTPDFCQANKLAAVATKLLGLTEAEALLGEQPSVPAEAAKAAGCDEPGGHAPERSAILVKEGWEELQSLGRSWRKSLERLPAGFNMQDATFGTSSRIRSIVSGRAFVAGLRGGGGGDGQVEKERMLSLQQELLRMGPEGDSEPPAKSASALEVMRSNRTQLLHSFLDADDVQFQIDNARMRFFDEPVLADPSSSESLKLLSTKQLGKSVSKTARKRYGRSKPMSRLATEVALGLSALPGGARKAPAKDVAELWSWMTFKRALGGKAHDVLDAAQALFNSSQRLRVLELDEDLKHHCKNGPLAGTQGFAVRYLAEWLQKLEEVEATGQPFLRFSFGHAETILPVLYWLGGPTQNGRGLAVEDFENTSLDQLKELISSLDRGESLESVSSKFFDTSAMVPFAAQLAVVGWRRKGGRGVERVQLLLNGRQLWPPPGDAAAAEGIPGAANADEFTDYVRKRLDLLPHHEERQTEL
eukprot:TRINITY_DN18754_c0_g1_i1.p1 TRINITY_DN18754_c0_g1~~TRINITY_DN18754_c0_g1_i1.p1  ORF type:complete len:549 (-),score=132.76 TRINITY_DN18754_c0_g1_i1:682-2328(-)